MQFHHHGYVNADPRVLPAEGTGTTRPSNLPDTMDVLIVGTGPAGMLLAAQMTQFPSVHTRIIERRAGRLEIGQADGLQARSLETFQAFGFAHRLLDEAYHITEMQYWRPDPKNRSHIYRADKSIDSAGFEDSPLSEFPHVICNQARVQDYFAEYAKNGPARIEPDYGWKFLDLEVEQGAEYPVVVRVQRTRPEDYVAHSRPHAANDPEEELDGEIRTIRAKYVVGCDGARSRVRKSIGASLHGDSRNHAWGVMDVLVDTNFPDVRTKCVIQSGEGGNILYIPREGNCLTRVYVDLGEIPANDNHKVRDTPIETIIAKAQEIFQPYRYDVKHVCWWSVYEVGQRLTDSFDDVSPDERGTRTPRVFIAGDACHTHSAKAGQGMNVSMQDAFNLGWKLGHVLTRRARESLLDTYSMERQVVAQKLIDFDREWSTMMASRTADPEHPELGGVDPAEVRALYDKSEIQASGFGVHYEASPITSTGEFQDLATGFPIGKRFHSAPVYRVCDATRQQLGHHMRADGRWRLYAFAGREALGEGGDVEKWAQWLTTSPESPYVSTRRDGDDEGAFFDVKVIWQQDHDTIEHTEVPEVFRPRFGPFQVHDEEHNYAADPTADIFETRTVSRDGCVVVVRPDMYVATVLPLNQPGKLTEFFAPLLQQVPASQ